MGDPFGTWLPVRRTLAGKPDGDAWLAKLPDLVAELIDEWSLEVGEPFGEGSCSWVAPVTDVEGRPAVLKVSWPHREAVGEPEALRLWAGEGAVRLYRADRERYALLLERCEPGLSLAASGQLGVEERLTVGAALLRRLWDVPVPARNGLERLADVTAEWADLVERRLAEFRPDFDVRLVALGTRLLRELPATAAREVVVHGDFNPQNVLSATREPWLAIDAKPMIGDPGYDPWPLIEQVDDPFEFSDAAAVLAERFAAVADVVGEPVRRLLSWAVARRVETALWCVAEGDEEDGHDVMAEAQLLAELAEL